MVPSLLRNICQRPATLNVVSITNIETLMVLPYDILVQTSLNFQYLRARSIASSYAKGSAS